MDRIHQTFYSTIYSSQCGYPHNLTGTSLHRVNKCSQLEALSSSRNTEKNKDNQSLFCVTELNPTKPPILEWIKKFWPVLYRSSGTCLLIDQDIVFGHRKPKSLQDILVHTDIVYLVILPIERKRHQSAIERNEGIVLT